MPGRRISRVLLLACVAASLAVLPAACGNDPAAVLTEPPTPTPPPVTDTYQIGRVRVEVVAGVCEYQIARSLVGTFEENGDSLRIEDLRYHSPWVWEGTVDSAGSFALEVTAFPLSFPLHPTTWVSEGSFSADRSTLTATEEFVGLHEGIFCHALVAWSGFKY